MASTGRRSSLGASGGDGHWRDLFGRQWDRSLAPFADLQALVTEGLPGDCLGKTGRVPLGALCRLVGTKCGLSFFGPVEVLPGGIVVHGASYSEDVAVLDALQKRMTDRAFRAFCEANGFQCERTWWRAESGVRPAAVEQIVLRACDEAWGHGARSRWVQVAYVHELRCAIRDPMPLRLTNSTCRVLSDLAAAQSAALSTAAEELDPRDMERLAVAVAAIFGQVHRVNSDLAKSLMSRRARLERTLSRGQAYFAHPCRAGSFVNSSLRRAVGFLGALVVLAYVQRFLAGGGVLGYLRPFALAGMFLSAGFALEMGLGALLTLGALRERNGWLRSVRVEHGLLERIGGAVSHDRRDALEQLKQLLRVKPQAANGLVPSESRSAGVAG